MARTFPTLILAGDSLLREGLRLLLTGTAFEARIGLAEADDIAPAVPIDTAVVLVMARDGALIDRIARIRAVVPDVRIVALADEGCAATLPAALDAGAHAVLLTSITAEGLLTALHAIVSEDIRVVDGRVWSARLPSPPIDLAAPAGPDGDPGPDDVALSLREMEILERITHGESNKHIARRLDIAEATVKAHVKTILRKIGAGNRTQAAIWALQNRPASSPRIEPAGLDRTPVEHDGNGFTRHPVPARPPVRF